MSGSPSAVTPFGIGMSERRITVSGCMSVTSKTNSLGMSVGVQLTSIESTVGSTRPPAAATAFDSPSIRKAMWTVISSFMLTWRKSMWFTVRRIGCRCISLTTAG